MCNRRHRYGICLCSFCCGTDEMKLATVMVLHKF